MAELERRLITKISSSNTLGRDWINPQTTLNSATAKRYLATCDTLLDNLLFLIHISSGQPARGAELTTITTHNMSQRPRAIYKIQGSIMILLGYNKTMSKMGTEKMIARFLTPELSKVLVYFIAVIRPFECFLCEEIQERQVETHVRQTLFIKKGRFLSEDRIRESFTSSFRKLTRCSNIGFLDYRHISKAFATAHLAISDDMAGNVMAHLQHGHSVQTGTNTYGISQIDLRNLTHGNLDGFWHVSRQWHRLLGLEGQDKPKGIQEPCGISGMNEIISGAIKRMTESTIVFQQEMSKHMQQTLGAYLANTSQDKGARKQEPHNALNWDVSNRLTQELILQGFRSFKSVQQHRAMIAVYRRDEDVLIVMPTGSGKSLTVLIPCSIEFKQQARLKTVYIVPFKVLYDSVETQCNKLCISSSKWSPNNPRPDSQLILVSAEHVGNVSFQQLVTTLVVENRLARIVVDEILIL
jgi:hypothetical protein